MKKLLKILGISILVFIGILIIAPFIFQDKIKAVVDKEIHRMIDAQVYFGDVSLSFIRNFPNASIRVEQFGIVGEDRFEGDTLVQAQDFQLVVDIFSIISGGTIQLNKLIVDEPKIHAIVLEDSTANWDILAETTDTVEVEKEEPSSPTSFQLTLKSYAINNADIRYEDATLPADIFIEGLTHSGSGAFTEVIYDVSTETIAKAITAEYEGVGYANGISLDANIDLNVNTQNGIAVAFRDNQVKINDFPVAFDGKINMLDENIDLDLTFNTSENVSFKSLLSLIPAIYKKEFDGLTASGNFSFDGMAKGRYNEQSLPAFTVNLVVEEGMMKYPELPEEINNINVDLHVNNPDGDLEKTQIDLNQFHADLGNNPINAKAKIEGLSKMKIDGDIKAVLNLEELTTIIPVEGNTLRGTFSIDANAKGTYDTLTNSFPKVVAQMGLKDGYLKNEEYPAEIQDLTFNASLMDPDGQMEKAVFDISSFSFKLDGEPIEGSAHVENFLDPSYIVKANGNLDFEKLTKIYPLEGMIVKGNMVLENFETEGKLSDVEAERYERLKSSGNVSLSSFYYADADIPQGVTIESASGSFTPSNLTFTEVKGRSGASDFNVNGYFNNYIAYALIPSEPLKGAVSLNSTRFDLNEFMIEESPSTTAQETASDDSSESSTPDEISVIPVPENIDLIIDAKINQVLYDKYVLNNVEGIIEVVDQKVLMDGVSFEFLGGQVGMSGNYNTQDIRKPTYAFHMDVENMGFKEVYSNFNTVQAFAPVTQYVTGQLNTSLNLTGPLDRHMNPILENLTGEGLFLALNGSISEFPLFKFLADKTKINAFNKMSFDDLKGNFSILNGFINIAPFDLKVGDIDMTISGRQNISGLMDFNIDLDMPNGALGNAAFGALTNLTGGSIQGSDRIQLSLKLGGNAQDPKLTGLQSNVVTDLKSQAVDALEQKLGEKLGTNLELNQDSLKAQSNAAKETISDSIQSLADQAKESLQDSLETAAEEAKEKLKEELNETIGDEVKGQLDQLKEKFKFPRKKDDGS